MQKDRPEFKESNPKDALGCKKPPLSTVPMPVIFEIGTAMLEGARKYARHNYRAVGIRASVYFDALMRHMCAWWEGEDDDPDSGISHVTKALACLVVLRDAMINDLVDDDRPPRPPAEWMSDIQQRVTEVLERYPDPPAPYTHNGRSTTTSDGGDESGGVS